MNALRLGKGGTGFDFFILIKIKASASINIVYKNHAIKMSSSSDDTVL